MIASEHKWCSSCLSNLENNVRELRASVRNLGEVFRMRIAEMPSLRDDDIQIAPVFYFITKCLKFFVQVGIAQSGRSHVHATPVGAEVHRHANNRDSPHIPYCSGQARTPRQ